MTDSTDAEGETLLAETVTEYDALDRAVRTVVSHFDPATGDPIGDGESETTTEYAADGRALSTTDDNGHVSGWTVLDTMNRVIASVDARGNARRMEYDEHSHVIATEEVEASDVAGAPERVTRTTMAYDALGRMVWRTDSRGSTTGFEYDSRGNAVRVVDPLGNVVENDYDAMGRLVATRRILTDDGTGGGSVVGEIETSQEWDESSRLVAQIDDAGNATRYEYDAQNRRVAEVAGDGTEKRTTYNVFGDAVRTLDANGPRVDNTFDKLGRALTRTIVPASGVIGTTWENWTWDGLSRPRRARNAQADVRRWYDSLGTTIKETVALKNVAATTETRCEHDGLGNVTRRFYPGGRVLLYSYDELNRLVAIHEEESGVAGRELVRYSYVGGRVTRADMGNCTRTDVLFDGATGDLPAAGDFGVGRVARVVHSRTDTSGAGPGEILDDRRSTWDRAGNRTSIHVVSSAGPENGVLRTFGYDSAYRMISSEGGLFGNVGYDIDGVGNRSEVTGGESPGEYSMDGDDALLNQYTSAPRPVGGPGGVVIGGGGDTVEASQSYDLNGNLIAVAGAGSVDAAMGYDWRNRMIRYADSVAGIEARYQYDPYGRRVFRETTTPASGSPTTSVVRYVYACDGWTVLEERRGSVGTGTRTSHVHGLRIDEAIMSLVETGAQAGRERWYLHDDLMTVHLVLDEAAEVVGFEAYGDYGAGVSFDVAGAPLAANAQRQFPRFTGREQDIETGFVHLRNRYMDPMQGRFTTRDPIGTWGDRMNVGGALAYASNSPGLHRDPAGLMTRAEWKCQCAETGRAGDELSLLTSAAALVDGLPMGWRPSENGCGYCALNMYNYMITTITTSPRITFPMCWKIAFVFAKKVTYYPFGPIHTAHQFVVSRPNIDGVGFTSQENHSSRVWDGWKNSSNFTRHCDFHTGSVGAYLQRYPNDGFVVNDPLPNEMSWWNIAEY